MQGIIKIKRNGGSEVGLFGLRGGEVVQEGSVLLETPFYFVVEHVLPTQHR